MNGCPRVRRPGAGQPAVIGLDLGTSGVKVLVTSPDGDILGRAVAGYPVSVPRPGQAEADPRDWWAGTRRAVQAALADAGDSRPVVTGLAVAGQMHGVVLVDDRGAALRPAILRLDQRAAAEASVYGEMPCDYTAPLRNHPSPGMAGPLLCWLATHEPHTLRSSWWALQPKDWLRLRLTGQAATDPTDASGTLMFDLARDTWAEPLLDKLGLPRDKIPPVRRPDEIAGVLLRGPAAELGLDPGIPVAVGAGDTAAALYAAGLQADEALLTLGSGGQWVIPVPRLPDNGGQATCLYRAVGRGYYRLAPVQNVGLTLDWVRNLLGATWDELYDTASRPRGAFVGERGDLIHGDVTHGDLIHNGLIYGDLIHNGLIYGDLMREIHGDLTREDLMRVALDEVAAQIGQRLADLRAIGHAPRRVVLGGGGTGHPAWRALLGEAIGLPLVPAPVSWLAAAGAARLAVDAARLAPGPAGGSGRTEVSRQPAD